jgi:hypothetical protein
METISVLCPKKLVGWDMGRCWCTVFFGKLIAAQLVKILLAFMEPEGSLPSSEEPTNVLYPEPVLN